MPRCPWASQMYLLTWIQWQVDTQGCSSQSWSVLMHPPSRVLCSFRLFAWCQSAVLFREHLVCEGEENEGLISKEPSLFFLFVFHFCLLLLTFHLLFLLLVSYPASLLCRYLQLLLTHKTKGWLVKNPTMGWWMVWWAMTPAMIFIFIIQLTSLD